MQPEVERPNIAALVDLLRERVEHRRQAGEYGADFEERMSDHFRRITHHRIEPNLDELRAAVEEIKSSSHFAMERVPLDSRLPGGSALQKTLAKMQSRQIIGVYEQVYQFAEAVRRALELMIAALENPNSHVHTDLVGQVDAAMETLSGYERAPVDSPQAVADLRRRVEELEAAERRRQFQPWFSNVRFGDEFRGSRAELLDRYRDLAAHFADSGPVLDIGCGRGEFLELLRELDVEARGVEMDPELVAECEHYGLKAEAGDGLAVLQGVPDRSLGGVVLIQVVEHLSGQQLLDLVLAAKDKLRPGGKIICETVNPQSLYVFARSFFLDPTHTQPIHPAYLAFLFQEAGFAEVAIDWRSPPPEDEVVPGDDAEAERLNQLLFAPQDYAVIATR